MEARTEARHLEMPRTPLSNLWNNSICRATNLCIRVSGASTMLKYNWIRAGFRSEGGGSNCLHLRGVWLAEVQEVSHHYPGKAGWLSSFCQGGQESAARTGSLKLEGSC